MDLAESVSLARYSTLHVGGEAQHFARVNTLDDLRAALAWADDRSLPWFILGGGANFFCRDEGFPGLVIKMECRSVSIGTRQPGTGNREFLAEAGAVTRVAVLRAVQEGLRGMERLAGIPGTIGGAVRGNAGAFGTETKDFLASARVLRRSAAGWEESILPRDQLFFAYRDSTFKREQLFREAGKAASVIWSATFSLAVGDRSEGERLVAEDLAARKAKQPYEFPSVGSIFKNPEPGRVFAGQLVEATGLKGLRVGGAEVSTKHANFIVNRGGATATDVVRLIGEIKKRVFDAHGIPLEEEIVVLSDSSKA